MNNMVWTKNISIISQAWFRNHIKIRIMTNKQKIEAAKARIKELERLIKCWEKYKNLVYHTFSLQRTNRSPTDISWSNKQISSLVL